MTRLQSSPAATAGWALRPVGNSEDRASRSFFVVAIHRRANTPPPSFETRAQVSTACWRGSRAEEAAQYLRERGYNAVFANDVGLSGRSDEDVFAYAWRDKRMVWTHDRDFLANFTYRAGSWTKPRRVVAKVEWHLGELYPRVGFIVTNLSRPAERVVGFYNQRGTCEQWIKEGKGAIRWTRLSCRSFAANAVRLQLHALAYNLGNFLRTLATPELIKDWSLTSLKEKLIKIGAKVVSHGRYVAFQMAEVAVPKVLFAEVLRLAELRPPPVTSIA